MSTFYQENPITKRIAHMHIQWADTVTEQTQLVRWLVDKDEVQMITAFHQLEASQHGKLPELFINFGQSFTDAEQYGKDLTDSWIDLWNNEEARNEALEANVLPDWDDTPYREVAIKDSALIFMQCMSSFATAISPQTVLILNIMPHGYVGDPKFVAWVKTCLNSLPSNLKLVVIDLKDNQKFKNIPPHIAHATLEPNLNMQQAIKEIASSAAAESPAAGINLCLLNMAEATAAKNKKQIHHWGKQGMKVAQETGLKSIEATVLIAYGCALYQLKKFDDALALFKEAEQTSIEGLDTDPTAPVLLLQAYNIQASTYFYKRKYTKAQEYYTKTAQQAKTHKNSMMHVEACRQAAYCAAKNGETKTAYALLQEGYLEGRTMEVETQKFSSMLLLLTKLHRRADRKGDEDLKEEIEQHAHSIWGDNWKETSEQKAYKKALTN